MMKKNISLGDATLSAAIVYWGNNYAKISFSYKKAGIFFMTKGFFRLLKSHYLS